MQKLPWLPRPLIIFALIAGKETPCVQWHGQDYRGNVTEEQMLFPLYGHDARYAEVVRPDFWRVSFLGSMNAWNEQHPERPFAHMVEDEVVEGGTIPIARMMANELFSHPTFSLTCFVVNCAENGLLYTPAVYENLDVYYELPKHEVDKDLQSDWRQFYRDSSCENISHSVDRVAGCDYMGVYARRYERWTREHIGR